MSRLAGSRARFEARAAAVRRRPWRLAGMVAAVLALVVGLGWVVWASPLLTATDVDVRGLDPRPAAAATGTGTARPSASGGGVPSTGPSATSSTSPSATPDPVAAATAASDRQAVLAALDAPLGTPLARVDTAVLSRRVAQLSFVREVTVTRGWPHTIVVTVVPRQALLAVKGPDGRLDLVDDQAVAFRSVETVPAGVALVNRSTSAPATEGLVAVIAVLRLLPEAQRAQVSEITVTSASLVSFSLGGTQVVWGGTGEEAKKLRVLEILLRTTPTPKVIDVSAPDTPVTR